jgi:hypothetical protein
MNGKQIQLTGRVIEMLEMYNQVYRDTSDMDIKFIAVLLIGIMSSGAENVTQRVAYDLAFNMYRFRVNRDGYRMSNFARYFQDGLKVAVGTIKMVKQNRLK